MANHTNTQAHDAHGHHDGEFAHPASLKMLFTIFFILLALTGLTVYQSTLELGGAEIYFSLFIASIKAGLVIMFFMHMLWDKMLNGIIFFSSLIFVTLFLGATLHDAHSYRDSVIDKDTLQESIPKAAAPAESSEAPVS